MTPIVTGPNPLGWSPAYRSLAWIAAGLLAWYGIRMVSPDVAGIILAAFVILALIKLGPTLAQIPRS